MTNAATLPTVNQVRQMSAAELVQLITDNGHRLGATDPTDTAMLRDYVLATFTLSMPETDTAARLHAAQKRVKAARKAAWDARYANSVIRTRSVNALTEAVIELTAAEEAAKEATVQAPAEPAKSLHPDTQREIDLTYAELQVARKALGTARSELLRAVMSNVPEVAAAARATRRLVQSSIEQLEEVERMYRESGAVRTDTEEGK